LRQALQPVHSRSSFLAFTLSSLRSIFMPGARRRMSAMLCEPDVPETGQERSYRLFEEKLRGAEIRFELFVHSRNSFFAFP
jgi:hypothetical protein